jgi:hypothetical protein
MKEERGVSFQWQQVDVICQPPHTSSFFNVLDLTLFTRDIATSGKSDITFVCDGEGFMCLQTLMRIFFSIFFEGSGAVQSKKLPC